MQKLLTFSALLILAACPARAHAFLDHASPSVGGAVSGSPSAVRLWFTELLEPKFSKAELAAENGAPVEAGPAAVDPDDRSELVIPIAKALPPGRYRVRWRAVSADTHVTQGNFTFEVAP